MDGSLRVSDSTSHAFPDVDRYSIGRLGDSTPNALTNGTIDQVIIYSRILSSDEISKSTMTSA